MAQGEKFVHMIELYFWDHIKRVNMRISCNIRKSPKNTTGNLQFLYVAAYLRVSGLLELGVRYKLVGFPGNDYKPKGIMARLMRSWTLESM